MKKQWIFTVFSFFGVMGMNGQNVYEAAKITQNDLNGTARFVGMGGAMSALGGDISTIGTNPAGIGIYRSNDVVTSFSFTPMQTKSQYDGTDYNNKDNHWAFDNLGVVLSFKIGNVTPLRYVNVGFNYHKVKSFYRNMSMEGTMYADERGYMSQARQMAEQANWSNDDLGAVGVFNNPNVGWLSALGWNSYMVGQDDASGLYFPYLSNAPYSRYNLKERGSIDQYDFNVSFNIKDRVYLGLTIGVYNVDYNKYANYDEDYGDTQGYNIDNYTGLEGSGFDFKFGAIVRPFEYSPLKVGIAFHSPTFYNLTLASSAYMVSDVLVDNQSMQYTVDTYEEMNGNGLMDFKFRTPWKYNFSLGYTVGNSLALGAEYEYQNYSKMDFYTTDGYEMNETNEAQLCLKGVHAFRIGAEYKIIPQLAVRAGYNYTSSPFKDDAIKALSTNSIETDTGFANLKHQNDYTVGIGYRGSMLYADIAYKRTAYKSDFYPFYNDFYTDSGAYDATVVPQATKVKDIRNQILFTVGLRF